MMKGAIEDNTLCALAWSDNLAPQIARLPAPFLPGDAARAPAVEPARATPPGPRSAPIWQKLVAGACASPLQYSIHIQNVMRLLDPRSIDRDCFRFR